ncbi:MAG TPA: D-glycerate dehydrogenase [Myxococcales bacterium]|nr:D-glycerate dehydrogenase [Deltaproteobacteria bacterium]MBU53960.1 D-glycerate dehydrogenase [Deltaproteobacteria bacterium]HAA54716.1 D-glycerate dehydrogenase [Myxococcales bacterium]|tara:strand:+ start:5651 stop:6661 length:1011 start_codon:yes stop_codon:yes gene_type:complete
MAKIFVTGPLPGLTPASFEEHDLYIHEGELSTEALYAQLADVDVLICQLSTPIDKHLFKAAPQLKIIANYAVGYNNVDVDWATMKDVAVLNTPDVLTDSTADLTMGLLLAAARRMGEGERMIRANRWEGWPPTQLLGTHVTGKQLGIIGFGRIGEAVARRAKAFSMPIAYHNTKRIPIGLAQEVGAFYMPLEELLRTSDFISLHCPLTPATQHLIGERELSWMKPEAFLINTSRGPVVDEHALVKALTEGTIKGAALDVFEHEPTIQEALKSMENVFLTPHLGSATEETRHAMTSILIKGIKDTLKFRHPTNIVNPEVLSSLWHSIRPAPHLRTAE